MIYELRTTRVRPGGVPEYERRLGEAVAERQGPGKLAGCWHTEIGPLLQVVELWSYADRDQREQAAGLASSLSSGGSLVQSTEIELLEPAAFMRPLDGTPQNLGPIYELRIYQVRSGQMPQMLERWGEKLAPREKLSPLAGAWHSEQGRWFHLWPYPDLAARTRIREEAITQKIWPPATGELLITQETKIMLPAHFSPLQ